MNTILLTGVTGQVGSALAPLLQEKGYRVLYLIRPGGGKDAAARLREVLPYVRREADIAIAGDVTLPYAGFNETERRKWRGCIDKIVHSAASIRLDESVAEETRRVNVGGTRNMLVLVSDLAVPEFHYLSTAYVAGNAESFSEFDFDEVGQTARNTYETTKRAAERLVRDWSSGGKSIYRLPIVIGDSRTGYTQSFTGYFGFFIGFWRLLQILRRKWEAEPRTLLAHGIRFDEDGFLVLPLSIGCSPISTLNLVTSDWLARTLADLVDLPARNQVFHLTNPKPPRVQWVIETTLEHLGIREVLYREKAYLSVRSSVIRKLQRRLDAGLKPFLPYVTHEAEFGCENLVRVLGERYVSPPAIDGALLAKMLDYAVSVSFGQRIHQMVMA